MKQKETIQHRPVQNRADHKNMFQERFSSAWSEDSIRLIMTPSTLAKSIYFYIQEAGYFKTTDSYFTERKNLNSLGR